MDWDDLRIFLAVARSESLSGAGRRLKIDPATVGRRIARLEEAAAARRFGEKPAGHGAAAAGRPVTGPVPLWWLGVGVGAATGRARPGRRLGPLAGAVDGPPVPPHDPHPSPAPTCATIRARL